MGPCGGDITVLNTCENLLNGEMVTPKALNMQDISTGFKAGRSVRYMLAVIFGERFPIKFSRCCQAKTLHLGNEAKKHQKKASIS